MNPLDVGVVGLGYFGSHHVRHHNAHPAARLAAVVDADLARAEAVAREYGTDAFTDHRSMIGKVDAASIAAPTSLHASVAGDLIDAGIHVLVEKPLAAGSTAAADLVERAAKRGVVLQVGHIERYAPVFAALREQVANPVAIRCTRHATWTGRAIDADVVLDLMIHDIDLALTLAAAPVVAVAASGVSVATNLNDMAEARLQFANGVVATLSASRVADMPERRITVAEPGRQLTADLSAQTLTVSAGSDDGVRVESKSLDRADNLAAEIDAFVTSVTTGSPPVVDGKAGLEAIVVAEQILSEIDRTRRTRVT
ncbi:Gfo/Idh/MocA family protein [Bauldia sp.]|uniref:Gfo/Idh/MocA family protein n=1 Tax=Bauldia sp. TaxID=2575872 RepID=UPI003BA90C80